VKVLVVNNMAPFVWGGAEELAANLEKNLIAAGHEAEVLRIPFRWEPASRIPSQMLMVRGFEMFNVDRVIALKFPAYLIRHPHKTLWVLRQYRQAYDLYDAGQSNVPEGPPGQEIRRVIQNADNEAFGESRGLFTISKTTQQRLAHYNGVNAEVLVPPLNDAELFAGGRAEGYIFAGGRINSMKRQHLLLEALALAPPQVRLVIAGPPDTPEDGMRLTQLVEALELGGRVKLDLRFLARTEVAQVVNHAAACACVPCNEDFSFVAVEAAAAGKPVITVHDSGGVGDLVRHLETGWVVAPEPRALADAMVAACLNATSAVKYGAAARDYWFSMGITWPKTVEKLLA
jgi:glycosyltransferase involved in cell wall biosynthesis